MYDYLRYQQIQFTSPTLRLYGFPCEYLQRGGDTQVRHIQDTNSNSCFARAHLDVRHGEDKHEACHVVQHPQLKSVLVIQLSQCWSPMIPKEHGVVVMITDHLLDAGRGVQSGHGTTAHSTWRRSKTESLTMGNRRRCHSCRMSSPLYLSSRILKIEYCTTKNKETRHTFGLFHRPCTILRMFAPTRLL